MPRLMLSETAVYEIRMHGGVRGGNREEPPYSIHPPLVLPRGGPRLSPGKRVDVVPTGNRLFLPSLYYVNFRARPEVAWRPGSGTQRLSIVLPPSKLFVFYPRQSFSRL